MVASHHHLSVKDDVETEDDRPDDGEHQPHCSSLKEQSPMYPKFRCFESSFQNAKIGSHLWEKQSDKASQAEDNEDAEQCAWYTNNDDMMKKEDL